MRSIVGDLLLLRLAEASAEPMNRRLYRGLREAILEGAIAADTRLPASRDLAAELGIARNTVVHVYSQLLAEGYTRSRQGNGTFVNASLPDSFLSSGRRARLAAAPQPRPALSPRGAAIVDGASASPYQWGAFMPGVPDLTEFPHRKFGRIVSALWRNPPPDLLTYAHGGGLPALREALAQHLALTRSIDCDPEQLIITEARTRPSTWPRASWAIRARWPGSRTRLLGRAHRAAGQWPAHPPSAGGRGRHAGAAGSRRRAAALHLRHAVASVPAGAGDVAGAPPPAAGGCAAPWQLDHRGRLRQRVPLLGAAHRLAAGAGAGCARDLHGHLQQDAVPGLRVGYLVLPRRWWRRSRRRTPSCTARATR